MAGEARPLTAVDASGEPLEALDLDQPEAEVTRQQQPPSALRWVALLSVPMLWGSFTPTMKLLLAVHRPPPALVTNLCSHVVGAVTLCIITLVTRPPPHCLGTTTRERRRMLRAPGRNGQLRQVATKTNCQTRPHGGSRSRQRCGLSLSCHGRGESNKTL